MIITQSTPFTLDQISSLKEQFSVYIKTVIDIDKKICSAGMDLHVEGEKMLLNQGSKQSHVWGGGIDLMTKEIDFNSFINIRVNDDNPKNEIQSETTKKSYKSLMQYFFQNFL